MSASFAAVAQAEVSEWMSQGETFSELSISEEAEATSGGPVTIKVAFFKLEIVCSGVKGEGKFVKAGATELTTQLSSCKVSGPAGCSVNEPVTLKTKSELIQTGNVYYDKLVAKEKNLGTLSFKGAECVLPEEAALTGELPVAISLEESEKFPMSFSEALQKTVNGALKKEGKSELNLLFGKQAMYLGGELLLAPSVAPKLLRQVPNTKLCPSNVPVCPLGEAYGIGTPIEALSANQSFFTFGGGTFECPESEITGTMSAASGAPLSVGIVNFNFGAECDEVGEACSSQPVGGLSFNFAAKGNGAGTFSIPNMVTTIDCLGLTCRFGKAEVKFAVTGGATASMQGGPFLLTLKPGSDAGCPESTTWRGPGPTNVLAYFFQRPTPMYVTG